MKRKMMGILLGGIMLMGCLSAAGCGGKRNISGSNALDIYLCEGGYGTSWLEESIRAFAELPVIKEKYPDFEYKITANDDFAFGQDQLRSGSTPMDLIFCSTFSPSTIEIAGKNGNASICEDLTDVFNSKIPTFRRAGEYEKNASGVEWTYKEKMDAQNPTNSGDIATVKYNENDEPIEYYYQSMHGESQYGIVYNETKMLEFGLIGKDANGNVTGLPRTTKELVEFAEKIKDSGHIATVASKDTGYWTHMMNLWWAQYEGMDAYRHFFMGEHLDDEGDWVCDIDTLNRPGRMKAAKALEDLLWYDNGYIFSESSVLSFTDAQAYLIDGNRGLFMANGDWFDNEMRSLQGQEGADATIRFMPTVVLSDCADNEPKGSIADETELRALIDAIRAGSSELSTDNYSVEREDYDYIYNAIHYYSTGHTKGGMVIPSYSDAKDLAKDFMLYLASDEALGIYTRDSGGAVAAHYYDVERLDPEFYASMSELQKDHRKIIAGSQSLVAYRTAPYPFTYRTSVSSLCEDGELYLFAKNAKDRKTAQEYFDERVGTYYANNGEQWNLLLQMAGLA